MFYKTLAIIITLLLPATLLAEGGGHHGPALWILWVNYLIFVGFFVYVLRKPFASMWSKRRNDLQDSILKAERELEAAEQELAEARTRYANASEEITQLEANIKQETSLEVSKIVEEAANQAERIANLASRNANSELEMELQKTQDNFADKVCELAKVKLEKEFDGQLDAQYRKAGLNGIKSIRN